MNNQTMYTFFSSNKNSVPSYTPNNKKTGYRKQQQTLPALTEISDDNSNYNYNTWSCDEKVKGSAVGCGVLGFLTCGVAGGVITTFMGYTCAKDNQGPIGEVFREVGDITCSFGGTIKNSRLLSKTMDAAKSVMGMDFQNSNVAVNNNGSISGNGKFLNADGEYIRGFETLD